VLDRRRLLFTCTADEHDSGKWTFIGLICDLVKDFQCIVALRVGPGSYFVLPPKSPNMKHMTMFDHVLPSGMNGIYVFQDLRYRYNRYHLGTWYFISLQVVGEFSFYLIWTFPRLEFGSRQKIRGSRSKDVHL
jgi:hypothetical protein